MNCPHCNREMELGKMEMISSPPGYISSTFIPQTELDKKLGDKVFEAIQEICKGEVSTGSKIPMKNLQKAYYCSSCGKAFVEFEQQ